MPKRRTKLFPTEEHLHHFSEDSVEGVIFHQFNALLVGLEKMLTNSELVSCRVVSLDPFEVWYDKEVPQQQVDAERFAFLSARLQEAISDSKCLDPEDLSYILNEAYKI